MLGIPHQVAPLQDQIEATISSATADGAYDGMPTYEVVAAHGKDIQVIIPPHVTAVLRDKSGHNPAQRAQYILSIAAHGRLGRQKETDFGQRALVEVAMGVTRPSSVLAYGHATSLAIRLKRLSAWPSSVECSSRVARTTFVA